MSDFCPVDVDNASTPPGKQNSDSSFLSVPEEEEMKKDL